jgi:putative addiction module CopG family antidote
VTLTPDLEQFATSVVAEGRYHDVAEMVRAGLSLLRDAEQERAAFIASLDERRAKLTEMGSPAPRTSTGPWRRCWTKSHAPKHEHTGGPDAGSTTGIRQGTSFHRLRQTRRGSQSSKLVPDLAAPRHPAATTCRFHVPPPIIGSRNRKAVQNPRSRENQTA